MMPNNDQYTEIVSPNDSALDKLCELLHALASDLEFPIADSKYNWPQPQLDLCAQYGVFKWFFEEQYGGFDWSKQDLILGYLALSAACQTTAFIITQRAGACRHIARSSNDYARKQLIPGLLGNNHFSTVGISHLTTSHRHLAQPVLQAEETENGFIKEKANLFFKVDLSRHLSDEYFVLFKDVLKNTWMKVGQSLPNYGLRIDDHTSFIRGGNVNSIFSENGTEYDEGLFFDVTSEPPI